MFIEQIKNKSNNIWLYIIVIAGFFTLMGVNFLLSSGVDSNEMIKTIIKQVGTNAAFVLIISPLSFMCLGLLFWVKIVHRQSITSLTTARKTIDWKRILFSFSIWGIVLIITTIIDYYSFPENFVINFKLKPFLIFLVLGLILIPLQTSFEEYFFRGYFMQALGIYTNSRLIPFLVTSITFGLMHIANPEVDKMGYISLIYYIGTGLFLGILTLMDDGLELSLGFHAANNLIGALLITSDWSALQTNSVLKDIANPSAGIDVLLPVFIIFPILLLIFSKKYKWSNWKEKLTGKLITYQSETIENN